jgi:hypothetical protein
MKRRGKIIRFGDPGSSAASGGRSREPKAREQPKEQPRGQRQPTIGELEQIVRDLLPEKWAKLKRLWNRALQRDAIKDVFEEALYIWQIAEGSCHRHKTVFDELADLHEKFKEFAALQQRGDIAACNAHKYLGLSEHRFRGAVWKKFVAPRLDGQDFNPLLPLPISFLDDIKASIEEASKSNARMRQARSRRSRASSKKNL